MEDTGIYPPGTIIDGRYRIESRLGRGGFATVYRAQHLQLDRPAALKVLEPIATFITERFYSRFETEARIAANLDHPNVVRIFDYGVIEPDNRPYIAMEMLDGRDLEQELELNPSVTPTRAKRLFEGVLDALRLGHERGIVHKDLKPSNLFLVGSGSPDERLVVLDYGIARLEGEDNPRYTEEGQYTGTPMYMPPEYIQNREVSPAFDVYQMGLIFIEAMTGQPVVVAGSNLEYMVAHIEGRHRIPQGFGDTPLGATLLKAISVDPADRYKDAGEMLDAVRMARVDSKTDYTLPAITVEDLPPELAPQAQANPPPAQKSNSGVFVVVAIVGVLALGALFVVAAAGALIWYAASHEPSDLPEPPPQSPITAPSPTPNQPATPNLDFRMPGTVDGSQEIFGLLLARYMVEATMYQVKLFEDSVKRSRGNWAQIFTPSGTQQMLDVAHQQIDRAGAAHGDDVADRADEMQAALRRIEVVLVDLHDYHSIEKGYESDGGDRGRELHKKLRQEMKRFRPKYTRFSHAVSRALQRFLEGRVDDYQGGEAPFLLRATRAMQAAQVTIERTSRSPKASSAQEAVATLEKANAELQDYIREHRSELGDRYSQTAGTHNQFLQALKQTYKKAKEIQTRARRGQDHQGEMQFLRMQLHSTFQSYNILTRY